MNNDIICIKVFNDFIKEVGNKSVKNDGCNRVLNLIDKYVVG